MAASEHAALVKTPAELVREQMDREAMVHPPLPEVLSPPLKQVLPQSVLASPEISGQAPVVPEAVLLPDAAVVLSADTELVPRLPETPVALPDSGPPSAFPDDKTPEASVAPVPETPQGPHISAGVIGKGDTASDILQKYVPVSTVQQLVQASSKSYSLTDIRIGQSYQVVASPDDGSIERFEYEIDRNKKLVLTREKNGFSSRVEPIEYEYELALIEGTIVSSLFQAFTLTGESPNLAVMLADIFASEINFIKDLRVNDRFTMLVEKRYKDGVFKNYGRVFGARFVNQGKKYEGFRFANDVGNRYYTGKGESLQKILLKAPLSFTRITSNYSLNRKHPVYFDNRPHEGVDYGAPTGTPVKAVGDGLITRAGWGNGFGNMVVIKHTSALESMYSHLSGFARGMKQGTRVKQGQVIGYVGSTGVATGPHLDFRLRQNGKYVNPTKVINPRAEALEAKRLREFSEFATRVRAYMDGKRDLASYKPGNVLP